ncbi:MAG TPA: hypothetical protein VN223_09750 [Candidatus Elarobacter sp.]|nr:hypothetical protein [Candidatus Elarobacter sp.]
MPIRSIGCISYFRLYLLTLLMLASAVVTPVHADEPTTNSVFADAPFEKWVAQGPRQEVPWKVHMSADRLSFHQRLIATIQVEVPGPELLKRSHDEDLVLLIQVRNGEGVSSRNFGLLELDNLKPEMKRSDIEFSWQAFAVPGQYEVSVALWDKKSGEHNFLRQLFHVDAYKNDPLPEMWRGLDAFEFWSAKRDGPDYMFHSDVEGHPHLPLATRRPIQMEVLLDLTPSAEIFRGNYGYYNRYLGAALPMFKLFNQIDVRNGSRNAAALDLVQRHMVFEQDDAKDLDWAILRKALSPDNGPGMVSVKDLQNRKQSPVYMREEIVGRLKAALDQPAGHGEKPLHVFVVIGSPMDFYVFPTLPAIETGNEQDCVIYYIQFNIFEHEQPRTYDLMRHRNGGLNRDRNSDRDADNFERGRFNGNAGSVEKMMKPLKIRAFQVRSPDDVRRALAKIMDDMGKL